MCRGAAEVTDPHAPGPRGGSGGRARPGPGPCRGEGTIVHFPVGGNQDALSSKTTRSGRDRGGRLGSQAARALLRPAVGVGGPGLRGGRRGLESAALPAREAEGVAEAWDTPAPGRGVPRFPLRLSGSGVKAPSRPSGAGSRGRDGRAPGGSSSVVRTASLSQPRLSSQQPGAHLGMAGCSQAGALQRGCHAAPRNASTPKIPTGGSCFRTGTDVIVSCEVTNVASRPSALPTPPSHAPAPAPAAGRGRNWAPASSRLSRGRDRAAPNCCLGSAGDARPVLGTTAGSVTSGDEGGSRQPPGGDGRRGLVSVDVHGGPCGGKRGQWHVQGPRQGWTPPLPREWGSLPGACRGSGAVPPGAPSSTSAPAWRFCAAPSSRKSPCPQRTTPRCWALGGFSWTVLAASRAPPAASRSESTPGPEAPLAEEAGAHGRARRGPGGSRAGGSPGRLTSPLCFLQAEALHLLQAAPESHQ